MFHNQHSNVFGRADLAGDGRCWEAKPTEGQFTITDVPFRYITYWTKQDDNNLEAILMATSEKRIRCRKKKEIRRQTFLSKQSCTSLSNSLGPSHVAIYTASYRLISGQNSQIDNWTRPFFSSIYAYETRDAKISSSICFNTSRNHILQKLPTLSITLIKRNNSYS